MVFNVTNNGMHLASRASAAVQRLATLLFGIFGLVFFTSVSTVAVADHMNGVYVGQDNANGAVLTLQQKGKNVSGTIVAANVKIDFQGTTNGQDSANCQVSVQENGKFYSGYMQMSLLQSALKVELQIQDNPKISGNYRFFRDAGGSAPPMQNKPATETLQPPKNVQPDDSKTKATGGLPNFD